MQADSSDISYNIAAIRTLMREAFTDRELIRFCQDQPAFRPVLTHFSSSAGLEVIIDAVIRYCYNRWLFNELLAEIKKTNPRQYERYESQLCILELDQGAAQLPDREFRYREDARALIGLAIDLSGSMAENIRNNTGGQFSRLEGFCRSLDRLAQEARRAIRESQLREANTSVDIFAYGFGLRDGEVCDLFSLLKLGRQIMSESRDLQQQRKHQLEERYGSYNGLGDLLRRYHFHSLVDGARDVMESYARQEVALEICGQVRERLKNTKDTTLPLEEVAELWTGSGDAFSNLEPLIYGNTPMQQAMTNALRRFREEYPSRPEGTIPLLFLLSDGEPTDGDPAPLAEELKSMGVTIVSCFVIDQDIANPRALFGRSEPGWSKAARLMFSMASTVKPNSDFAEFLLERGWTIQKNAKLFVQLNHSEILEEFIQVVLSPLEERKQVETLPRGV